MQGLAAPVEKWFLNSLTKSYEYSNWVDRTIKLKQTHSGPAVLAVFEITGRLLAIGD